MPWDVYDVSLQIIRCLREPIGRLHRVDAALTDQIRRAASAVPLNLSERSRRAGKDRACLWRVAAGSAEEVGASLQVAQAWCHLDSGAIAEALALLDRLLAMLHRMTR